MQVATRCILAAAFAGAVIILSDPSSAAAQVIPEPTMLTARVPQTETFQAYFALPSNSFAFAGMLRIPVARDVDIGGRAGLWLIDDRKDAPFVGIDLRYGLLGRPLDPGGAQLSVALDFGAGVSDPGRTLWKFPIGLIVGFDFGLGPGDAEIFVNPRIEVGIATNPAETDAALLLDLGALIPLTPKFGGQIGLRFGDGNFFEGDKTVLALGGVWRI